MTYQEALKEYERWVSGGRSGMLKHAVIDGLASRPTPTPGEAMYPHNPDHKVGTCGKCGKEARHNVPRLGEAGGFTHADGSPICVTAPGEAMEGGGQTPFMYVCPKCYHTAPEPIKHIAPADEQENMENGAPMEHCESDMIALYDRPSRDFAPAPLDGETPEEAKVHEAIRWFKRDSGDPVSSEMGNRLVAYADSLDRRLRSSQTRKEPT